MICKQLKIPLAGIVSRNEPYPECKNKLLVINLDSIEGAGTHWVGLIEFDSHYEYCDSYGFDAPEEVIQYIGDKVMLYQNEQLQSINSKKCGWFVLYWAWLRLVQGNSPAIVFKRHINEMTVKRFKRSINRSLKIR